MNTVSMVTLKKIGIAFSLLCSTALFADTDVDTSSIPDSTPVQSNADGRSEVEKQRKWAEDEIRKTLIPEAKAVFTDTQKAIDQINQDKNKEALATVEGAKGKVDGLLARFQAAALLPIDFNVELVDTAPVRLEAIKDIAKDAERAVRERDFPDARVLLSALQSEIDTTTYNVPLGIYPDALKKAAELLKQDKSVEASIVLQAIQNAVVVINRTIPIPLIDSVFLIGLADKAQKVDKTRADKLLNFARYELDRAVELGYISKSDDEYSDLNAVIKDFQKDIKNDSGNPSTFQKIKDKFHAFIKRHFEDKKQAAKPADQK